MTWVRVGDNAATYPKVMRALALVEDVAEPEQAVLINELTGFITRLATLSGSHLSDYVVDVGSVHMIGGARASRLLQVALATGLLEATADAAEQNYRIVEDPDFINLRLKAEVEWDRRRGRDTTNATLTVPVRLRDGDACRYCARIVNWLDRKGTLGGTYDHVTPTVGAETPDDLCVACRGCNARRSDHAEAAQTLLALPVPPEKFYGQHTVAFLAKHGHNVPLSTQRPGTPPATATPAEEPHQSLQGRAPASASTPAAAPAGTQPDLEPAAPPEEPNPTTGVGVPAAEVSTTPHEAPAPTRALAIHQVPAGTHRRTPESTPQCAPPLTAAEQVRPTSPTVGLTDAGYPLQRREPRDLPTSDDQRPRRPRGRRGRRRPRAQADAA